MKNHWEYNTVKEILQDESLPAMIVDMDQLDYNISQVSAKSEKYGKKVRLASKSIRVPALIKYILQKGGDNYQGIMCFSIEEAIYLSSLNLTEDILIAYPTTSENDIRDFCNLSARQDRFVLMVDCIDHIQLIEREQQKRESSGSVKICIDVDMSWRPMGMHLGVHRSPVRSLNDFKVLHKYIESSKWVDLTGVMGYEAQVAGMGERNPFSYFLNPIKKFIKRKSIKDVSQKRKKINDYLEMHGVDLDIFNGGGSGSLISTSKEPWITEVTAGSGFLQSHLFDYYAENTNVPAFSFALPITRFPQKGIVTCKSGGFIASGETSKDKSPIPFLPEGLKITNNEGFGEVQTPVKIPVDMKMKPGDPIFFRPAKAGEIAERFNEYILIRKGKIIDRVPTYRGLGKCFF